MNNTVEKVNLQFIALPNDLIKEESITPINLLVYLGIKAFDGLTKCYPSIESICNLLNISKGTFETHLQPLIDTGWISKQCEGKGSKTYYSFKSFDTFEPFTRTFLLRKDLDTTEKCYIASTQQYTKKIDLDTAYMEYKASKISKLIKMPIRTVYRVEESLQQKNVLKIDKYDNGCQVRTFDLRAYSGRIAFDLRYDTTQFGIPNLYDRPNDDIEQLEKDSNNSNCIEQTQDKNYTELLNCIKKLTEATEGLASIFERIISTNEKCIDYILQEKYNQFLQAKHQQII